MSAAEDVKQYVETLDVKKEWLGVTLKYENFAEAHNQVLKVESIRPDSPFSKAVSVHKDFRPGKEFILAAKSEGSGSITFESMANLADFITQNDQKQVQLLVYNSISQEFRWITLTPDSEWDGQGCLGCDILMGALHQITVPVAGDKQELKAAVCLEELEPLEVDYTKQAEHWDSSQSDKVYEEPDEVLHSPGKEQALEEFEENGLELEMQEPVEKLKAN